MSEITKTSNCIFIDISNKTLIGKSTFKENSPASNKWVFPGGKLEKNESNLEALIREVEEECGFIIDPDRHNVNLFATIKEDNWESTYYIVHINEFLYDLELNDIGLCKDEFIDISILSFGEIIEYMPEYKNCSNHFKKLIPELNKLFPEIEKISLFSLTV